MHLGEGADAVGREELVLVEQEAEHLQEVVACGDGQQVAELATLQRVQGRNLGVWQGRGRSHTHVHSHNIYTLIHNHLHLHAHPPTHSHTHA